MSKKTFSQARSELVDKMTSAFGGKERFVQLEEQIRRNISMFEEAIRMFSPFALRSDAGRDENTNNEQKPTSGDGDDLETVKQQLKEIQKELAALSGKSKDKKSQHQSETIF
mgnify:CR=1 FL=1